MKDPYLVLGLLVEKDQPSDKLSDQQVKSAYLQLVQQYSPDRHPERFQAIRAAYEQLESHKKRLQYELFDTTLADRDDLIAALLPDNKTMQRPDLASVQRILKERV